jgi:hypothetical protein
MITPIKYNPKYDNLPRVSQIIRDTQCQSKKNGIGKWRAEVGKEEADRITETAINRGNYFHEQVEMYAKNIHNQNKINVSPSIDEFIKEHTIEIIFVEGYVYDEEIGYKGRTDMLYKKNGVFGILDWKTSYRKKPKNFFPDTKIQVSAYAKGIEKMYNIEIDEAMVVVAIPNIKSNDPFEPLEELWDFQIEKLQKKDIKRSFNRFVKKVHLFKNPPPPPPKKILVKRKQKNEIPIIHNNNPFEVHRF